MSTVSDNLSGLFNSLPVLRTGEAIIVGEAVHLPLRSQIEYPAKNKRPGSSDPIIYGYDTPGGWDREREPSNYKEVVDLWRNQITKRQASSKGEG